ncbi:fec operon regulator FecR [compost metagenome]
MRTAEGWVRPAAFSRVVIGRDLPGVIGSQVQVFAGSASVELLQGGSYGVEAGRQLDFTGNRLLKQERVGTSALAWTDGMLVAERMPLGLLLTHLDCYRRGVLRCAPEVAGLPVSGSYSLERPDASLDLLAQVLPIRVERVFGLWASVGPA